MPAGSDRERRASSQCPRPGRGRVCTGTRAQRNLFARLLSCLRRCLATSQRYDETIAFPNPATKTRAAAA